MNKSIKKNTKNGAPIKAVTTPIGKLEAVGKTLEIKSQKTISNNYDPIYRNFSIFLNQEIFPAL